jgi:hypothetical protein
VSDYERAILEAQVGNASQEAFFSSLDDHTREEAKRVMREHNELMEWFTRTLTETNPREVGRHAALISREVIMRSMEWNYLKIHMAEFSKRFKSPK